MGLNDCFVPPAPITSLAAADAPTGPVSQTFSATTPHLPPAHLPPELLHRLRPHPLLRSWPLADGYCVACVPSASQVVVLNAAAQEFIERLPLGSAPAAPHQLAAAAALYRAGLLNDGTAALAPPPEARVLMAWLHITNACNLNCHYCYIDKSREKMSPETAFAAVDTVVRSACLNGYREVALKYAGGEASLEMPLVARTHRYALQQMAAHGLSFQASLLSNGALLTPARLQAIQLPDLHLTISLDGLGSAHDSQRPGLNGRGSFEATLQGIEHACAAGMRPTIAITVSRQTVAGLPDLVAWLLARDLPFTINFYRTHATGSAPDGLQPDEQDLIAGLRQTYAAIAHNPPRWSVLSSLLDHTDLAQARPHGCAAGHNYLVIDHHGRIAQCQMMLKQPVTDLSALDPLVPIRVSQDSLQFVPVDEHADCQTCDWRYWCGGGCPVATHRAQGRADMPSPHCHIYQSLFSDVLRLEGLRLLHWFRQTPTPETAPLQPGTNP